MKFYGSQSEGTHKVRITFQFEQFKGSITKDFDEGNCKGLDVLKASADFYMEKLLGRIDEYTEDKCKLKFKDGKGLDYDYFTLELTSENGDTCEFEVQYQELQEMIVAIEILSFEPKKQKRVEGEG